MIRMKMSDVAEHIEELIEAKLTIHITEDDSDKILAVLMPYIEHEEMKAEIVQLQNIISNK